MKNKAPAFQFYPADYVSDINVILISNQQRGCYWQLMCQEWLSNGKGIPKEVGELARICGESVKDMEKLWEGLEECFIPHPKDESKLIHPRLEKQRNKQKENKKRRVSAGKKGADARWGNDGKAIGQPSHCDNNANDLPMAKNGSSSSSAS
tara:strand:+ start:38 stop:490 length:453 start_codon:yes stop_codon:yes gene_type:complete